MRKSVIAILISACIFSLANSYALEEDSSSTEASLLQSPVHIGLDLQYAPIRYSSYTLTDTVTNSGSGNLVHIGIDWIFFRKYGKLGLGFGFGFYSQTNIDLQNQIDTANLYTLPLDMNLCYRLEYFENQLLVPFAKVGLEYTFVTESASTPVGARSTTRTYTGLDFGGGLQFSLGALDTRAASALAKSIGIYRTFLSFEYVHSGFLATATDVNLTRDEFRFGLRFEM